MLNTQSIKNHIHLIKPEYKANIPNYLLITCQTDNSLNRDGN